jgi:hypothetical protein
MSLSTRSQPDTASVYQSWYTAEALETLTYANPLPKLPVYKYVFLPQDNNTAFPEQMRALQMIKNTLKTSHACFIAMEPGDFQTSHYIFGVFIGQSLLIINPWANPDIQDFINTWHKLSEICTLIQFTYPTHLSRWIKKQ